MGKILIPRSTKFSLIFNPMICGRIEKGEKKSENLESRVFFHYHNNKAYQICRGNI